MNTIQA